MAASTTTLAGLAADPALSKALPTIRTTSSFDSTSQIPSAAMQTHGFGFKRVARNRTLRNEAVMRDDQQACFEWPTAQKRQRVKLTEALNINSRGGAPSGR